MDDLKKEMRQLKVPQVALAQYLGINPSYFNLIINGKRPAPEGFQGKAAVGLAILAKAERFAEEARKKVLGG